MTVVEHRPWQRALTILVPVVVGFACLLLGYGLGHQEFISDAVTRSQLTRELQALQARREHPSELVREHVAWALEQHGDCDPARSEHGEQ